MTVPSSLNKYNNFLLLMQWATKLALQMLYLVCLECPSDLDVLFKGTVSKDAGRWLLWHINISQLWCRAIKFTTKLDDIKANLACILMIALFSHKSNRYKLYSSVETAICGQQHRWDQSLRVTALFYLAVRYQTTVGQTCMEPYLMIPHQKSPLHIGK